MKPLKENCKYIDVQTLNKYRCFKYNAHGAVITWKMGFDEKEMTVGYVMDLREKTFKLKYQVRRTDDEAWKVIEHEYPLTATQCHFGGIRWWFICSCFRNGYYCGRRVGKLYLHYSGHYFACRHCNNLTYATRIKNNRGRFGFLGRFMDLEEQVVKLSDAVKFPFRAGKPTKKYLQLLRKRSALYGSSKAVANWKPYKK